MQTNQILDKIIKYAIFKNADTIDIDYENNNLTINIIGKLLNDNFFVNKRTELPLINLLKNEYQTQKKHFVNNTPYRLTPRFFNKEYGQRIIISITPETFKPLLLESIGFNQNQLNIINNNISKKAKLNLIIGPPNSGLTTTLYSIANHTNTHNANIYLIEKESALNLEGINQINDPFNQSSKYNNFLQLINKHNPDLIILDKPNPEIIKESANISYNGTPITLSMNEENITNALASLIKNKINAKILSEILNLIIFQNNTNNSRHFKTLKANTILKNTLKHPRLSKTLLSKAINQNILSS